MGFLLDITFGVVQNVLVALLSAIFQVPLTVLTNVLTSTFTPPG